MGPGSAEGGVGGGSLQAVVRRGVSHRRWRTCLAKSNCKVFQNLPTQKTKNHESRRGAAYIYYI